MAFRVWASAWFAALALIGAPALAQAKPIEVRVVIIATWESFEGGKDQGGELHHWQYDWPLRQALPFPVGVHPLQYDPKTHVLALLTGMATARAAASVTALGTDPRFDLTHAYWIVAGTAGVDPQVASAGSMAWSRWVVDGDLAQEVDPRDAPADWPTGILPYKRNTPYELPAPNAHNDDGNIAYRLNRKLVDWAYGRTKDLALKDSAPIQALRAPYSGPGGKPPFVLEGDGLMSARFWYGDKLTMWARRWVDYWSHGEGRFVMSAEEDSGIMQALTFLSGAKKVDLDRVLILRGASDYAVPPPGMSATDFLAKENSDDFPGTPGALDNLYVVASPVARQLAADWVHTRDHIPGG